MCDVYTYVWGDMVCVCVMCMCGVMCMGGVMYMCGVVSMSGVMWRVMCDVYVMCEL